MNKMLTALMLTAVVCIAGCHCGKESEQAAMPQMAEPETAKSPCAAPSVEKISHSFPASGAVRIEKFVPQRVNTNAAFEYRIEISNLSEYKLQNVIVTDQVPAGLVLEGSTPQMRKTNDGSLAWNLGEIEPKGSRMIIVNAMAKKTGILDTCAQVSYDCPACATIAVVEPKLMLTRSAPSEILSCDRLPLKYVITNTGTGHACDITITEKLPAGLQTAQGEDSVAFKLDSLAPGESKEFEAMVDATRTGTFSGRASASAADLPSVESDASATIVKRPVLSLDNEYPAQRFIGRPMTFEITIKNTGDGIAQDAVVVASVPENAKFVGATEGGNYTHMSPGKVTWNLGSLSPDSSKIVSMELVSDQPGQISSMATANAKCADTVSISGQTNVMGIPAILLEVVDDPDPVEVGKDVTYTIIATNQGSTPNTDLRITCTLEKTMKFVSSSGPTKSEIDDAGSILTFEALSSLAPKEKAEWKVVIKAMDVGDVRFKTSMIDSRLTRPVEETEATTFYK